MTSRRLAALLAALSVTTMFFAVRAGAAQVTEPPLVATPQAECGPGSRPETDIQGRVPTEDYASGRAAEGYTCNAVRVGGFAQGDQGLLGGYKVERYTDAAGHDCAYYDTTLLAGTDVFDGGVGVNVMDMSDPTNPVLTATLVTPAMVSPHESLVLSQERGVLAAVLGNPSTNVGQLDVYDISADCRTPEFKSSTPAGIFGHESGMSPDGFTFYAASPATGTLIAVDLTNLLAPVPISYLDIRSHGLSISADGNRAYIATTDRGLVILDVSEVQARNADPVMREISELDWSSRSIPQNAIPVTINGLEYVVEIDEFGEFSAVGAGRIIDISDELNPFVVSNLRLEVHQPENFDATRSDPGTDNPIQGYAGHYCNVPTRVDPTIVACSMINSGLRVFDISDPVNPVEVAYHNVPAPQGQPIEGSYAMSSPSFVTERNEIWYSDGHTGLHVVRLTNEVWPAAPDAAPPAQVDDTVAPPAQVDGTEASAPGGQLPATGGSMPLPLVLFAAGCAVAALLLLTARGRVTAP